MPNRRHIIIGKPTLARAVRDVTGELRRLDIWPRLVDVPLVRSLFGVALGYYTPPDGRFNDVIEIPAVSLGRIQHCFWWLPKHSLRDIIRHEYGHAFAYRHRQLITSRWFRLAFGLPHDVERASVYDTTYHVSEYAATRPYEDFAEVFMCFLRHRGRLPVRFNHPGIAAKWLFVAAACEQAADAPTAWSSRSLRRLRAVARLAAA